MQSKPSWKAVSKIYETALGWSSEKKKDASGIIRAASELFGSGMFLINQGDIYGPCKSK